MLTYNLSMVNKVGVAVWCCCLQWVVLSNNIINIKIVAVKPISCIEMLNEVKGL